MREFLRRLLPYVGYGSFYFAAFFLSIYLAFPYDRVRDRVIFEFAKQQKGTSPMVLEIDELHPYWFSGVEAKGVRLTIPPKDTFTTSKDDDKTPTVIELDEVRVRMSILKRIFGKSDVSIYAKAFGGEVTGTLVDAATERSIDLEIDAMNVGDITPLSGLVGLPMVGTLQGTISLSLPEKRASKANGSVKMSITGLSIGDGKAKIKNTLALPRMNVGELALEAEVTSGAVKLSKLAGTGTDLEMVTEGKVTLRDVIIESISDLYVRFKFSDAYKGKNDITKGLFGAPGSTAPALFELADPKIKQSKRTDGFYGWHMVGMISSPRFDPFAGTVPASAPKKDKPKDEKEK